VVVIHVLGDDAGDAALGVLFQLSQANVNLEEYSGLDCFIGVDLSSTSDLTSFSVMIPTTEKMVWKTFYFLPEAALTEKRFKELYGEWARQGALCITPGNVVDYDFILNKIIEIGQILNIVTIGYDSWNATQFVINCTEKGLPMEPYSQSIGNFNKPTKELERLLLSGVAVIDNNIITRHCFRNVVMARDKNGNTKPSKQYEEKKIDGVIAMIEALGVYLMCPRYDNVIY
jgi:phage terminase large subunit-like protein